MNCAHHAARWWHHAHIVRHNLLRGAMETAKNLHCFCDGIGRKEARTEYSLAEARDFAVFVEGAEAPSLQACDFQPDGVGAVINRGKRGHGEGSQFTCQRRDRHGGWLLALGLGSWPLANSGKSRG